jgi:chorismate dehydratase
VQASLRIGCVKYLNARPLIRGWPGKIEFDHPSELCHRLARGELDVALVSSFEFLRNPIYGIVDDISISSDGSVYSVVVAHRGEISEIEEIELDPAALTSVALLRCLLAESHLNLRFVSASAAKPLGQQRGLLLIGDQAIRFRQDHPEFEFWDLGKEWERRFHLPFVYALWLIRPEVSDAKAMANRLRALRNENLANLNVLIAAEEDFDQEFCKVYYNDYLRFHFGEKEKEGLRKFQRLCEKHGLLPKREIEFNVV